MYFGMGESFEGMREKEGFFGEKAFGESDFLIPVYEILDSISG